MDVGPEGGQANTPSIDEDYEDDDDNNNEYNNNENIEEEGIGKRKVRRKRNRGKWTRKHQTKKWLTQTVDRHLNIVSRPSPQTGEGASDGVVTLARLGDLETQCKGH